MSFELKDGRYHIAFWVLDYPQGNCMISVFRDEPSDPWTCLLRLRTYIDDKVFESKDRKKWLKAEFPAEWTEQEASDHMDKGLPGVMENMAGVGYSTAKLHKIEIHSDDPKVAAEVMRTNPAFHPCNAKKDADGNIELDTDSYDTEADVWNKMRDKDD